MTTLLDVRGLTKHFSLSGGGTLKAVEDVSFSLAKGETLGIVGESGCGKSTLARLVVRLIEPTSGEVDFAGTQVNRLSQKALRLSRRDFQLIFQDPFASLDPRQSVGTSIAEPMVIHKIGDRRSRKLKVVELLEKVGLDADAATRYPHEFSGGQRQRIGIARAVALGPKLIIADEPVSALDVSIQSQILNLLMDLKHDLGLSYIFISHDLSVVEHVADRVAVMYLGRFVEVTDAETLYKEPRHPYTEALLSAVPVPDPTRRRERIVLPGDMPSAEAPPPGCAFHPRCPKAFDRCPHDEPGEIDVGVKDGAKHLVRCHLYG
ncbi:MAG: oligopeptide/dipeptide ABC transporter ATP-binding protein [Pseudomonadota bacterium]